MPAFVRETQRILKARGDIARSSEGTLRSK
jgi:hypothetical protein